MRMQPSHAVAAPSFRNFDASTRCYVTRPNSRESQHMVAFQPCSQGVSPVFVYTGRYTAVCTAALGEKMKYSLKPDQTL